MRLSIRHLARLTFEPKAPAAALRFKLFPSAFDGQKALAWRVTLDGAPVTPDFHNGYGDGVATRQIRGGVEEVEIVAAGDVETVDAAGVLKGLRAPLKPGVCLRETPRTRIDAAIAALAKEAAGEGGPLARAHALQDAVTERMELREQGAPAATAAAALTAGEGTPADFAHVLIAAARSLGWPARFAAGYRLGEAATVSAVDAWAEIWVEEIGWIGFDAARDLCPTDSYVRLCSGLDAVDAAPLRAHAEGGSEITVETEVTVVGKGDLTESTRTQSQSQSQAGEKRT